MNENDKTNRRKVIGGLGAGLAAAAVSPGIWCQWSNPMPLQFRPLLCRTLPPNTRNHLLTVSRSHGLAWRVK